MATIILDSLKFKDDKPYYKEESIPGRTEITKDNTDMYFELYKEGRLKDISDYCVEHPGRDGYTVIDFVIDKGKLSQDFIEEMDKRFPKNSLKECDNFGHCDYLNCVGLVYRPFSTFREEAGITGRSFEHPLATGFYPKDCYDFLVIAENNVSDACIEAIKRKWGESSVKAQTKEEHEAENALMYEDYEDSYKEGKQTSKDENIRE